MALSDADLRGIAAHQEPRVLLHHEVVKFARAIEAEVRKQDDALILQLVEALEGYRRNHNDNQPCDAERAGRARLAPPQPTA